MIALPGYRLAAKLGEGHQSVVYRGFQEIAPEQPLTIKVFKTASLPARKEAHIRQKVEHLQVLHDAALLTPRSFDVKGGVPFLVEDYFEGLPLDEWARRHPDCPLDAFFTIACSLAMAFDKVHEAGIIHGGVKPHNILVHPTTLETRLTGFVTPLDVRDVSHFIYDPDFIRGTLAYTSPEQTGRIHHVVVFSSDLYSLGIVFYELLTGRLPFLSTDPLALIHQHLAEEAPPVQELKPEIPATLSQIVARLTLKQPEKRYQSGRGLLADLVRCREEWEVGRSIGRFPLATQDRSRRVIFISKMVGRDDEANAVLDAYEPATRGEFRAVFISGMPGIGKTRLIQELQQPIVRHRGYFTSGKFDIYQKNIPYSSIIQALRNLVRTFLTESPERISAWQGRILDAVGPNGRVLIDVIPELEALIGAQPAVGPLPPVEARNRFHNLFDRFLGCLAGEESPLTLFIDDLQWCDVASFDFLTTVFANPEEHPYLLLLGAYRDNEVDAGHPLARLIARVKADRKPLAEVRLRPLAPEHCHEMVSYILDAPLSHTEALAGFLADLTEGNPLFVSESLSFLYNEDLLYVDDGLQWRWDLDRIRRSNMPSTVVALFSSKISRLPPETVDLLETCACMGNTVAPGDLARVRALRLRDVFETLKPSLGQGLMIENRGQLQFIHDRVQEAVLTAIPPDRRRAIHWRVGEQLLATVPAGSDLEALDNLFAIVSHLNLGRPETLAREEAYRLADINFHAGEKALNALATDAANGFFATSKELLPPDCWEAEYELTFRVFRKAAKTELMCGRPNRSEELLDQVLEHARTDLDRAECLAEQTTSLSSIGNFIKAIETANRGLSYFGRSLPADPAEAERCRAEMAAGLTAGQEDVWGRILHMPFTTDRRSKIELAFYSELIPDLYMSGLVPQLYLSAVQSTRHCLAGGMDESVIYSFSIMGLQLGEQEAFEEAFRYEDLARELSARHPNTFGATRGMNGIVWCNMHSRSSPAEIVEYCRRGIQCGKNCGDLYNAGLSYGPLMWNLQVQGADLSVIEECARECRHFSERNNLAFSVGLAEAMQAGWIEPMKEGYQPVPMDDRVARWEGDNHVAAAGSYYAHLALAHYYFGEHQEAAAALAGVERYLSGLTDNVLKRQWYVFQVLNALKLHEGAGDGGPEAVRAEIAPLVAKIETWARLGPLLRPYLAFLHAERERVTGRFEPARGLYLDAIESAHHHGYTFLEGHLNECLGDLLVSSGRGPARAYFTEAARLYRRCRAERKEARLLDRHPELLEEAAAPSTGATVDVAAARPYALPQLDVGYLMRSALAISAEIEEDAVLRRIMQTVMESSGAQHGHLLIFEGDHLRIRAEGHTGSGDTVKTADQRLEDATGICRAVVRYVFRTGQRLLLADASQDGDFKDNPEVCSLGLRSVLCLPVLRKSRLVGVLYLENRLAPSVFTPSGTQTTELLTAQAAISLDNARLVEAMKRAEEALDRERERLAVTLHSIGDAVIATDTERRVVMLNRAGEELTGWPQAEAFGRDLADIFRIVNEKTLAPCEDPVRKVLESGQVVGLANHTALIRRDGRRLSIADSAAPIRGRDGSILGVVLVFRDVTEARRSEEALHLREQELSELTRTLERRVRDRTADLDRANQTLRLISECNQVLVRITDEAELVSEICRLVVGMGGFRTAWVGYTGQDGDGALRPVAVQGFEDGGQDLCSSVRPGVGNGCDPIGECVRTGRVRLKPALHACPEACPSRAEALRRGYGSLIALPLATEGDPFGALTIYSERSGAFDASLVSLLRELADDLAYGITSLRAKVERDHATRVAEHRADQLRALATELVQAEQRERQRLAKILHDHLQQLLVAAKFSIGSVTGRSRDNLVREGCAQITDVLDQAIQAARSLTAELSPPVLQDKGLVAGLEWLARHMREKHGLQVEVLVDRPVPSLGQPLRIFLFEAVRELLFNVVKHAGVQTARVRCDRNDREFMVTVEDDGVGFDAERPGSGAEFATGFGLFSIRERVEYLGGRLVAESSSGAGSRMRLALPLRLAEPESAARGLVSNGSGNALRRLTSEVLPEGRGLKIRVLLVDDHPVVRQGLARLLQDQPDIDVVGEAGDGRAAVELTRELQPDVVIMDVSLPVMNGVAATQVVHGEMPEVAVIGLSMHEDPAMVAAMREAGAVDFLTKGGPPDAILLAIRARARPEPEA